MIDRDCLRSSERAREMSSRFCKILFGTDGRIGRSRHTMDTTFVWDKSDHTVGLVIRGADLTEDFEMRLRAYGIY